MPRAGFRWNPAPRRADDVVVPHRIRSSTMTSNPPRVDPALISALRADLHTSQFTVAGVLDLLGPMAAAALDREQALPVQRVTAATGMRRAARYPTVHPR